MGNKCLAIIGAGGAALPFIEKAKLLGIKTVAFAKNGSVAQNNVDIFVEENSFDIDFICKKCRELGVDGVLASNEMSTEVTAYVADRLGLPGNDVNLGFAAKNKFVMRSRVSVLKSIKQPLFELYDETHNYDFPVVVKAVDAGGKRGMTLVRQKCDLSGAVLKAKENSSNGQVLVEEYLEGGKEYSIECLSHDGIYEVIQYTKKEVSEPPFFAEIGHHQPANLSEGNREKIKIAVKDVLQVLGINCGMAHLELKIINNELFFIEVGARAGGDHIGDTLVPLSTGFDYYKAAILCSLGMYKSQSIKNIAYSGIYFHCKQNERLAPLFERSKIAPWSIYNTLKETTYSVVASNSEAVGSGYFIYCADTKLNLRTHENCGYLALELNPLPNAYQLIWNYYKKNGRNISDNDLKLGIKKFLTKGHVVAIVHNEQIIGFALLYCSRKDLLDAYICNVFVLEEYRGKGIFKILFDKAVWICKQEGFSSISLNVAQDNEHAIEVYNHLGFVTTGNRNEKNEIEMKLDI